MEMKKNKSFGVEENLIITCPAGFYPKNAWELRRMVEQYLMVTKRDVNERIFSLIVPHAGYFYSGLTAGWGYRQVQDEKYDTIVVIAPSHYERFSYASILASGIYRTPLGDMVTDKEFAEQLVEMDKINFKITQRGHISIYGTSEEHSISVHIPFLQVIQPQARIVPILIGTNEIDILKQVGFALGGLAVKSNCLLVASSDLSHFYANDYARKLDFRTLKAIEAGEPITFLDLIESGDIEACGSSAIAIILFANGKAGVKNSKIVHYSNSSDASPEMRNRVVGYGAVIFWK